MKLLKCITNNIFEGNSKVYYKCKVNNKLDDYMVHLSKFQSGSRVGQLLLILPTFEVLWR